MQKRKLRKKLTLNKLLALVLLCAAAVILIKQQGEINYYNKKISNLKSEIKTEEELTKELEEKLAKIDAQKRYMAIGMSEEMAEEAATAELAGESDKVTELYKKFNNASIKAAQAEWQKSRPPVNAGQGWKRRSIPKRV